MSLEKSAGAVIFRKEKGKNFYLLLHYPSGVRTPDKDYWDFPKGHIEKGEKSEDAARREIFEETGIKDIEFIPGFKEIIKYFYKLKGKNIFKTVVFYLVKTKQKNVKISWEHIGYKWLSYPRVVKQLTFGNTKEIFKKANQFLLDSKLKIKNQDLA